MVVKCVAFVVSQKVSDIAKALCGALLKAPIKILTIYLTLGLSKVVKTIDLCY